MNNDFMQSLLELFGLGKKKEPVSPYANVQKAALEGGPTAYSNAMMANLGMNVVNPGYQGGPRSTSMMAGPVPDYTGYAPNEPPVDPLKTLIDTMKESADAAPATSTGAGKKVGNLGNGNGNMIGYRTGGLNYGPPVQYRPAPKYDPAKAAERQFNPGALTDLLAKFGGQ